MTHNNAKFFVPGARVAYARTFLQSIADYSYDTAQKRGTIIETSAIWENSPTMVVGVQWDDEEKPRAVLSTNLWPAERIHLEPV